MSAQKLGLLKELESNTFVRILPSAIHGIGVFAIKPIPKACRDFFSKEEGEWTELSFEEVADLPESSRALIETYCLFNETHYYVPSKGFKVMDLSLFLNHSTEPNIKSVNDGLEFEALRAIEVGEELLIDYGTIVTSDE